MNSGSVTAGTVGRQVEAEPGTTCGELGCCSDSTGTALLLCDVTLTVNNVKCQLFAHGVSEGTFFISTGTHHSSGGGTNLQKIQ